MSKRNDKPARAVGATAADSELDALAFHLSEALRIARTHPGLPASLYNELAEAVNEHENRMPNSHRLCDSREYISLLLHTAHGRKGGAK